MNDFRILIIDDDRLMRNSLVDLLEAAGWSTKALARATDTERWITQFNPDVILSDVRMPEMSGLELVQSLPQPGPPAVLISAHGDIPMAVEAMSSGAYSFVEKPYEPKRLLSILSHAAEQHRMRNSNARLRQRLQQLTGLDRVLLGDTPRMQKLRDMISVLADSDASVLIHGETGTGKDLVARALHDIGARCDGPFVAVNAAQFNAEQLPLIARGAAGGTLFLDEICACPMDVQPILLRLIDAKEILEPDQGLPETIDLRVVTATNEDVENAVEAGRLRRDLLHRIDTFDLHLPPLRARLDDVAMLSERFLADFASLYQIEPPQLSETDLAALIGHDWPGNVRELRNIIERHIIMTRHGGGTIAEVLSTGSSDLPPSLREAVAAFERQIIGKAIVSHQGRMDDVADFLGIARRTLNEKIVKLGLDKDALL